MKKFLTVIMLSAAIFSLRANDQAKLKKICKDYHQFIIDGTFEKIVPFLHPSYKHTEPGGKTLNYAKVKQLSAIYQAYNKAASPNASLADIMEFASTFRGQKFDSAMRKQFDAIENTEEGKQLKMQLGMMIGAASLKLQSEKAKMANAWKTFKLVSLKTEGNNGKIIFEMQDTDSPKMERSEWDMIKVNGKWLIKNSVTTLL